MNLLSLVSSKFIGFIIIGGFGFFVHFHKYLVCMFNWNSELLFLDEQMMYSSAVFEPGEQSLEVASRAKLERVCQKLELEAGDPLLEVGAGWGGLASYAAFSKRSRRKLMRRAAAGITGAKEAVDRHHPVVAPAIF